MQQSKTESSYHSLCFGPSVVDPAEGKDAWEKDRVEQTYDRNSIAHAIEEIIVQFQ